MCFSKRDVVNHIFHYPRMYHSKLIDALGYLESSAVSHVAQISETFITLRQSIHTCNTHKLDSQSVTQDVAEQMEKLRRQIRALRSIKDNKVVLATAQTIELASDLLWGAQPEANLALLAAELKETLEQIPMRACLYMDLTSCQLIIGATAAEKGTTTREWFVDKLKSAAQAMQSRGWIQPFDILEKGLQADRDLAGWLTMLKPDLLNT